MGYINFLEFVLGVMLFLKIILNIGYKWEYKNEPRKDILLRIVITILCWFIIIWVDYLFLSDSLPLVVELAKKHILN